MTVSFLDVRWSPNVWGIGLVWRMSLLMTHALRNYSRVSTRLWNNFFWNNFQGIIFEGGRYTIKLEMIEKEEAQQVLSEYLEVSPEGKLILHMNPKSEKKEQPPQKAEKTQASEAASKVEKPQASEAAPKVEKPQAAKVLHLLQKEHLRDRLTRQRQRQQVLSEFYRPKTAMSVWNIPSEKGSGRRMMAKEASVQMRPLKWRNWYQRWESRNSSVPVRHWEHPPRDSSQVGLP